MSALARVTDYLVDDHERLHLLLALACAGDAVDLEAYASFRAGLLRHIAIEEKLVFPAVRAAVPRVDDLKADHARFASLLVWTPDLERCGELAYLLGRHDALEEGPDGVYEACERALGPDASAALAARARRFGEVRVAAYREPVASWKRGTNAPKHVPQGD